MVIVGNWTASIGWEKVFTVIISGEVSQEFQACATMAEPMVNPSRMTTHQKNLSKRCLLDEMYAQPCSVVDSQYSKKEFPIFFFVLFL